MRNGLTRAAAVSAEIIGKNSEETKKLKNELEKQIKANADALLEQDAKLTSYTAHYTMLLDKQATVVTEMQGKHLDAMSGLQQKMLDNEEVHARRLQESEQVRKDNEASHQMAMDDLRQQLLQQQQISIHQQQVQLAFASKADSLTATLAAYMERSDRFMEAIKVEMLTQKQEVQMIKNAHVEEDDQLGYVEAVMQQHAALLGELASLQAQVTVFATSVRAGRRETAEGKEEVTACSHLEPCQDPRTR